MKNTKGQGLLEIIIAVAILSITIMSAMTMTRAETINTRDLRDRVMATTLAKNMLVLIDHGRCRYLERGVLQDDGSYLVADALWFIPTASLAMGSSPDGSIKGSLEEWVEEKSRVEGNEFNVSLTWNRNCSDSSPIGAAVCRVQWKSLSGGERCVELSQIVAR